MGGREGEEEEEKKDEKRRGKGEWEEFGHGPFDVAFRYSHIFIGTGIQVTLNTNILPYITTYTACILYQEPAYRNHNH